MILGIDPGWASFGISVENGGKVHAKMSCIPRDHGGDIVGFMTYLSLWLYEEAKVRNVTDVYLERFVAYKGIHSDASENILMLIGALNYHFADDGANVHMVRAIDWKPTICKYLVRTKNFNNPYPSFDKQFSVLAATELSDIPTKIDHEADAICLSYLKVVEEYNSSRRQQ